MVDDSNSNQDDLIELLNTKIENMRPKLLDLSRRNPLISAKLGPRTNSSVRIVDELPDVLAFNLTNNQKMRFVSLPPFESDPIDEQSREFQAALSQARLTDEEYLNAQDQIDPDQEDSLEKIKLIERSLKDRVRILLDMAPHSSMDDISVAQHAKNNHISPSYNLPLPQEEHEDGRHTDTDIQTLLLPDDLDRKMSAIVSKCRTWVQETGVNVLQAAFGFLEWKEPTGQAVCMAPLVLASVDVEKVRTQGGFEFWVKGRGEDIETNLVLAEKLKIDFGLELPAFDGGSIEDYFQIVTDSSPSNLDFSVRRQVVFGVFPSARMAMYHDLNTEQNKYDQSDVLKSILVGSGSSEAAPFADEYEVDSPEIEKKVPNIVLDADSSQYCTLVDIADGKNVAVEGPPGTGKSQTIVNAIAAALSDGKRVLFVAQKMAALEVVRSRLDAIGLGEFVLPLQAERSTREKVINSVRDRIDVRPTFNKQEYETKRSSLKQYRSELAEYVDVISQPFGNAGFTVHDILGKSMATQQFLSSLPSEVQKYGIDNVENLSHTDHSRIAEQSEQFENALRNSRSANQYWQGHKIQSIDKFKVEEVCETSKSASEAYTHAGNLLQDFKNFKIEATEKPEDLDLLSTTLSQLEKLPPLTDVDLVVALLDKEALECLESFLLECGTYQSMEMQLAEKIHEPLDPDWESKFQRLHDISEEFGFDLLDPDKLTQDMREDAKWLESLRLISQVMKPFVEAFPECTDIPVARLADAKILLANVPNSVLALRNETTSDPDSALIIREARVLGEKLRNEKTQLEKKLSLRPTFDTEQLSKHTAILRHSNVFSFLSSNYRQAKNAYLELSLTSTFSRLTATAELDSLCKWQADLDTFCSNTNLDRVFGHHNKYIDTDFSLFTDLVDYFEAVDTTFLGLENLHIRKTLKRADVELLKSIPEVGVGDWKGSSVDIKNEIGVLAQRLEKIAAAIKELSSITQMIHCENGFHSSEIQNTRSLVHTLRLAKDKLDSKVDIGRLIGDSFSGANTDQNTCSSHRQAAQIISSVDPGWQLALLDLLESPGRASECNELVLDVVQANGSANILLEQLSQLTGIPNNRFSENRSLNEIASELLEAAKDANGLYVHSNLLNARHEFQKCGLPEPLAHFFVSDARVFEIKKAVDALIARSLAIRVFQEFGSGISKFNGEKLDNLRRNLAATDRSLIKLSRDYIRSEICRAAAPPSGNRMGKKSTWTEWALVENEINKKKRFISVRYLTHRAGKALLELKPCWMMSPLAVAQYLPRGKMTFDLCIIDEASQMPPEDAIGALSRCDQAVVVGDTNQLPPTSFFRRMIDDDDADEDDNVIDESVLELANSAFRPKRRLRWHYRSRHSGLIQFSNRHVYDDDLIVFPSANENRKDMGVSLVQVAGSYKSGVNGSEATAMIDAIMNFMYHNPKRSLGVVTLNQKQRDLISEEMDYVLRNDRVSSRYIDDWKARNDGLESFFIKNLENVQGDQRDVIFIGTVYGPAEPGGPVMQRFGPINGMAGKRRLNVLFSRAKEQIVTFSSMTSADIRANEYGNPGTYMLKQWLEYSVTGILDAGEVTNREPDSVFEEFVIDQIHSMGCIPVPQVGVSGYFIDIGVRHSDWPHGFVLGVECDGATYHSSKSARDRDRLRQEVLERLGWHLHRIWSTDWFNDPQKEGERLRNVISARLEKLKSTIDDFASAPDIATPPPSSQEEEDEELGFSDSSDNETEEPETTFVETPNEIAVGDTVHVRYLSGSKNQMILTLSRTENDPANGIVSIHEPLGEALLGAEEGEEFEVLVGSYVRQAVVEKLEKGESSPATTQQGPVNVDVSARAQRPSESMPRSLDRNREPQPPSPATGVTSGSKLSPDQFYEPGYLHVVRDLSSSFIESLGPLTFKHLCEKVARAHGFQRTGSQIRKIVWAAVHKNWKPVKGPKGENIFWPTDRPPEPLIPFRGMVVDGEERTWQQVPYPEKLGLAHSVVIANRTRDPIEAMARKIGLGRLREKTKAELQELLQAAASFTPPHE